MDDDEKHHARYWEPVSGILFGRDASLPALVLLLIFVAGLNHFNREDEKKRLAQEEAEAARLEDQAREEAQEEAPALSPWLDGAILLQSSGYFFFGMGMGLGLGLSS